MGMVNEEKIISIIGKFSITGEVVSASRLAIGHINDTFVITVLKDNVHVKYILQKINSEIFTRPEQMMENIRIVTEAIRQNDESEGEDSQQCSVSLVSTGNGGHYYRDDEGEYFRCYNFIADTKTYDYITADEKGRGIAREAGMAFAKFQRQLSCLDPEDLHITIDDFHNTPVRLSNLIRAMEQDPRNRAASCKKEMEFILHRERLATMITNRIKNGEIPLRIAHNDTKINNILFSTRDSETPRAVCVVDLDTVMPGSILFDFGDQVRTTASTAAEDERDLDTVSVDLGLFEALASGYLAGTQDMLTESERNLLASSGRVITFETGIRFLCDYLMGDRYFRIERPEHNLDRARAQLRLVSQMEKCEKEMEAIIKKHS